MKADIHPEYDEAVITCSCGNTIRTRSTKPDMHIDVCNECHPFFTGEQRIVDTAGRVERFQRRYSLGDPQELPTNATVDASDDDVEDDT